MVGNDCKGCIREVIFLGEAADLKCQGRAMHEGMRDVKRLAIGIGVVAAVGVATGILLALKIGQDKCESDRPAHHYGRHCHRCNRDGDMSGAGVCCSCAAEMRQATKVLADTM